MLYSAINAKKPTLQGWLFTLQINELPEFDMERAMGIEPTAQAWEAWVLPLYDARERRHSMRLRAALQSL